VGTPWFFVVHSGVEIQAALKHTSTHTGDSTGLTLHITQLPCQLQESDKYLWVLGHHEAYISQDKFLLEHFINYSGPNDFTSSWVCQNTKHSPIAQTSRSAVGLLVAKSWTTPTRHITGRPLACPLHDWQLEWNPLYIFPQFRQYITYTSQYMQNKRKE
jgi:hypothetical protein